MELIEAKKNSFEMLYSKQIAWKYDLPDDVPLVRADRKLVGRVIDNIVNNAIRFLPRNDGEITIGIAYEPDNKNVQIAIKDNGPGIPSKVQERIFEKFYQIENSGHKGDVGLGLAFCRLAIDSMKGKIWAESDGENGAAFFFTLPVV